MVKKGHEERNQYQSEGFLQYFSKQGIPDFLSLEVYKYIQDFRGAKDFAVQPADDLYKVYGIWSEDLDDAVLQLAQKIGCPKPTTEDVKDMPPVHTIEDLVWLLFRLYERNIKGSVD